MEHRGEIVENAVRKSGYPIASIAKRLGRSRRWMYLMFENPNVPFEFILKIGSIIHYDFSREIKELRPSAYTSYPQGGDTNFVSDEDAGYWKRKYYDLLEDYHDLAKRIKPEQGS